ncbi:CdaR family protein [Pseudodesulfovibrio sp. zrk46]|uniref:CdaR family protein n=1 Tax=Pseudodesulfovibrio sp. zrk46 TaxID=2725288 RepID=UPI001448D93C|nr:CdaR family protein [Pseudodesulfovibrio sp. zrk46]QJB54925.1 YbbR-like domain-containing protein [Pseudodesulfovibrio sp. zrk46]
MMRNWQTMILALALAIFTWFLVTGREVVEAWVDMPIVMTNPPEGMIIEEGLVDKIQVRLRGPKGLVASLSAQNLTYPLDVSHLRIGEQVLDIVRDKMPLTSSYEVIEIKPNRLKLLVDRRISKKIALEAVWAGALNSDYKLLEVVAAPDLVEIRGPETKLRKISKAKVVLKEDFPEEVPRTWSEDVPIELPDEIEASPGQVRMEAFFGPKTRDIWVKLPLQVVAPGGVKATPVQDYVRLQIEGPIALFRNNEYRKDMAATLVFGPQMALGSFDLEYEVVLPEGCRLLKKNPETVKTTIKK